MPIEMREPTFFILTSLMNGRKHGYAIIAETAELSGDALRLQVGTLYAALERLVGEGWVREDGEETVSGRHRRYYAITDAGVEALASEATRLRDRAATATRLLRRHREGYAL
jgi:PadR family transcriptional regulator PadR